MTEWIDLNSGTEKIFKVESIVDTRLPSTKKKIGLCKSQPKLIRFLPCKDDNLSNN
jgi:hypothetical protein